MILIILLVILIILLAINICLIFKNANKKYGGMESETTNIIRYNPTSLEAPTIHSVDETIQYIGGDIYQIPEVVITDIIHSEHNFFNPTDISFILSSDLMLFCFIKKYYLYSPCYILLTYQKTTITEKKLNLLSKEYLDIDRNIMVPNSMVEQYLTKSIPTYIKLSESQYNKMDNTILLEYKLLPMNNDQIIFTINNEITDTISSTIIQHRIVSSKLNDIIILLGTLVPDIDKLSYYIVIRLSPHYRVLFNNLKIQFCIDFNPITGTYKYKQIDYTYFTDLEKDYESTEIIYDENYDLISFTVDDIIYISDTLPIQLSEISDIISSVASDRSVASADIGDITSDATSDITRPLFKIKTVNLIFDNFIEKYISSVFITNYNLYQFLIVLKSYSILSKQHKFYKFKFIEFVNFTFKLYTIEDRLKIIHLITDKLWESESEEFIQQIFKSLNDAFILYIRAQRDHNLFDCSDGYGHGIIPEINEANTIISDGIDSTLGRGTTSVVNSCALSSNPTYHYALKGNCYDNPEIVLRLNHPFIVKYFKAKSSCVLELCYDMPSSDINIKQIIIQLIFALTYLESLSITHGDLHMNNMMIGRDGYLRLIDFDISSLTPSRVDYNAFRDLLIGNGVGTGRIIGLSPFKTYIQDCHRDININDFISILRLESFKFKDLKDSNWVKITNGNSNYYDFLIQKETLGI